MQFDNLCHNIKCNISIINLTSCIYLYSNHLTKLARFLQSKLNLIQIIINGFRENINIYIFLPSSFTMMTIENYIFILKGLSIEFPHRCPTLYKWGLEIMSTLRCNPITPIFIMKKHKQKYPPDQYKKEY